MVLLTTELCNVGSNQRYIVKRPATEQELVTVISAAYISLFRFD